MHMINNVINTINNINIAVIGYPRVGKSTLINAITLMTYQDKNVIAPCKINNGDLKDCSNDYKNEQCNDKIYRLIKYNINNQLNNQLNDKIFTIIDSLNNFIDTNDNINFIELSINDNLHKTIYEYDIDIFIVMFDINDELDIQIFNFLSTIVEYLEAQCHGLLYILFNKLDNDIEFFDSDKQNNTINSKIPIRYAFFDEDIANNYFENFKKINIFMRDRKCTYSIDVCSAINIYANRMIKYTIDSTQWNIKDYILNNIITYGCGKVFLNSFKNTIQKIDYIKKVYQTTNIIYNDLIKNSGYNDFRRNIIDYVNNNDIYEYHVNRKLFCLVNSRTLSNDKKHEKTNIKIYGDDFTNYVNDIYELLYNINVDRYKRNVEILVDAIIYFIKSLIDIITIQKKILLDDNVHTSKILENLNNIIDAIKKISEQMTMLIKHYNIKSTVYYTELQILSNEMIDLRQHIYYELLNREIKYEILEELIKNDDLNDLNKINLQRYNLLIKKNISNDINKIGNLINNIKALCKKYNRKNNFEKYIIPIMESIKIKSEHYDIINYTNINLIAENTQYIQLTILHQYFWSLIKKNNYCNILENNFMSYELFMNHYNYVITINNIINDIISYMN